MAATPAIKMHMDGLEPYATTGQPDAQGVFHLPKVKQGSTYVFDLTLDGFPSGYTLASFSFEGHLRQGFNSDVREGAFEFQIDTPSAGMLRVVIPEAVTTAMSVTQGVYDIEATDLTGGGDGEPNAVDRWFEGTYQLSLEATKADS